MLKFSFKWHLMQFLIADLHQVQTSISTLDNFLKILVQKNILDLIDIPSSFANKFDYLSRSRPNPSGKLRCCPLIVVK
jgi:hypothetical protein